jgi:hypothetical protein
MRKIVACSTFLLSILAMLQSCSKQSLNKPGGNGINSSEQGPATPTIIYTTISSGNRYSLDFALSSRVSITHQASHFRLSEMGTAKNDGSISYTYSPEDKYSGADEVTLSCEGAGPVVNSGCHGSDPDNASGNKTIVIKINVSN